MKLEKYGEELWGGGVEYKNTEISVEKLEGKMPLAGPTG